MSHQYAQQVGNLIESGLDSPHIGLHGTSIETVLSLAENGRLPNTGRHPDKFYFYHTKDFEPGRLESEADLYAEWNAHKHFVLGKLPFNPPQDRAKEFHEELSCYITMGYETWPEDIPLLMELCQQHGIDKRALASILDEARNTRSGVTLSVSPIVKERFTIKEDEYDDTIAESYIEVPGGLPIEFLSGIVPNGMYERDVLKALQDDHKLPALR
jgi:hypothetical protein|tara:strand:+ start:79 stop:720 length:642 start_codon:yes stop_codon:yes gene_type:complete